MLSFQPYPVPTPVEVHVYSESTSSWWGTLPQWLSGAGALVASGWAVWVYRQSVKERQVAAPRLVVSSKEADLRLYKFNDEFQRPAAMSDNKRLQVVWDPTFSFVEETDITGWYRVGDFNDGIGIMIVKVTNSSDDVVSSLRMSIINPDEGRSPRSQELPWQFLSPKETQYFATFFMQVGTPDADDIHQSFVPMLRFKDAAGNEWERVATGPVKRVLPTPPAISERFTLLGRRVAGVGRWLGPRLRIRPRVGNAEDA